MIIIHYVSVRLSPWDSGNIFVSFKEQSWLEKKNTDKI